MSPDIRQKLADYLANDAEFKQIYDYTRRRFEAVPELTAHNWEHAYRDVINSIAIGEAEGADMSIVLPAMVTHDIGFLYGATGKTHGALGAEKLAQFLQEGDIKLKPNKQSQIEACILTHKGSMHSEAPESLEAKVVSDADFLEKFGPVGVYQSIRTYTEFNYDVHRVVRNLLAMKDWQLQTKTGHQLAEERKQFSTEFAQALQQSYQVYAAEGTETA